MAIHELRTYRLARGAGIDAMARFFHGDGRTDYRAALREAGIPFVAGWRTASIAAGAAEEFVWIRAFENGIHKQEACDRLYGSQLWKDKLKREAEEIVTEVATVDLTPLEARELLAGPRARGLHELRHYRLAANALPRMLAFFEDVRRLMPKHGVRVLAWWAAEVDGSERFLWLREFESPEHKARAFPQIYESDLWRTQFKPRAVGLIEERILADLEPIPAERLGGHDPL